MLFFFDWFLHRARFSLLLLNRFTLLFRSLLPYLLLINRLFPRRCWISLYGLRLLNRFLLYRLFIVLCFGLRLSLLLLLLKVIALIVLVLGPLPRWSLLRIIPCGLVLLDIFPISVVIVDLSTSHSNTVEAGPQAREELREKQLTPLTKRITTPLKETSKAPVLGTML